ncbi:MAG: hypothetical protein ACOC12_02160 [Bacteroidota bacterium]
MRIKRRNIIHVILLLMGIMGYYWLATHYSTTGFGHELISENSCMFLSYHCCDQEQTQEEKIHTTLAGVFPVVKKIEIPLTQCMKPNYLFQSHWQPPKFV